MNNLYTIGFTEKTAEEFFTLLMKAGVKTLIDTRINTVSQLAGFAKKTDLPYFLKVIGNISYLHEPLFAPTKELLASYRNKELTWEEYEIIYINLIKERKVESLFSVADLNDSCLLCSENLPDHCHRRLLADYLKHNLNGIHVTHLY
ncbi:MAG: hypothetical protein FMNOHCHN_02176 [Ignavibacteriaceae bacterium]|nr:hypothetical protein [Ignavibacteriaceae bacterium]